MSVHRRYLVMLERGTKRKRYILPLYVGMLIPKSIKESKMVEVSVLKFSDDEVILSIKPLNSANGGDSNDS